MTGAGIGAIVGQLLEGLRVTLELSALCTALSLVAGTLIGIARTAPLAMVRAAGAIYVEGFRNVPPLILLFFFFFGLPGIDITIDGFACGAWAITLYTSAFVAEAVRAGIGAVDRGQVDAIRSLGFGYAGALRHVVMPQAIAIVLPALGNIVIGIVKNTALVASIGVADLMHQGEVVESQTFRTFATFGAVAALYLAIIVPIGIGFAALDRRRLRKVR